MSIMIVDDATIMRIVMTDILTKHCGYKKADIIEATGGSEAIRLYAQRRPALVFCDIAMPDMSGYDVVKSIIAQYPDARFVMCSANSDATAVAKCIAAGAKDYIVKPPKQDRVKQAIEKLTAQLVDEEAPPK